MFFKKIEPGISVRFTIYLLCLAFLTFVAFGCGEGDDGVSAIGGAPSKAIAYDANILGRGRGYSTGIMSNTRRYGTRYSLASHAKLNELYLKLQ